MTERYVPGCLVSGGYWTNNNVVTHHVIVSGPLQTHYQTRHPNSMGTYFLINDDGSLILVNYITAWAQLVQEGTCD